MQAPRGAVFLICADDDSSCFSTTSFLIWLVHIAIPRLKYGAIHLLVRKRAFYIVKCYNPCIPYLLYPDFVTAKSHMDPHLWTVRADKEIDLEPACATITRPGS